MRMDACHAHAHVGWLARQVAKLGRKLMKRTETGSCGWGKDTTTDISGTCVCCIVYDVCGLHAQAQLQKAKSERTHA